MKPTLLIACCFLSACGFPSTNPAAEGPRIKKYGDKELVSTYFGIYRNFQSYGSVRSIAETELMSRGLLRKKMLPHVQSKYPALGMTQSEVLLTVGPPQRMNTSHSIYGDREQWIYNSHYLYFTDGQLTSLDQVGL